MYMYLIFIENKKINNFCVNHCTDKLKYLCTDKLFTHDGNLEKDSQVAGCRALAYAKDPFGLPPCVKEDWDTTLIKGSKSLILNN